MKIQPFVIRSRFIPVLALSVLIAGCSSATGVQSMDAHGVSLQISRDGTSVNGDSVTIRVTNAGNQTAYLPRCGVGPAFMFNKWDGTQWTPVGAVACALSVDTGPVPLAPGATIVFARFISEVGLYRGAIGVGNQSTLTDEQTAISNSVEITLR